MIMAGSRLACLTTSAALGGAETSLLTLLAALRRLEPAWAITVVAPSDGPMLDRCQTLGIDFLVLPYPAALRAFGETGLTASTSTSSLVRQLFGMAVSAPRYVRDLRATLRGIGATVVHSNGLKAHVASALARPKGVRLVWHLHDYVQGRPLSAAVLRRLAPRADAIVTNSDSVCADVVAALGRQRNLRRIYNAVDLLAFGPVGPAVDLAGLCGLAPDTGLVRIGLIGTYARWKGHGVFIEAIAGMLTRDTVRAYIVGGPIYETAGSQWSIDELRGRVQALGLDGRVGFTGHIADVPGALRSLDIVVHASTAPEPFGMVIAEGMAAARAVVAARHGGAAELFTDGVTGLGHLAGDAGQLAEVLDRLVSDGSLRATLGQAARAAACQRFAPERMALEFREVYGQ